MVEKIMPKIDLKSEVGVDYTKLSALLEAQDWLEADIETLFIMLRASGSTDDYVGEMREFPCTDLHIIDQLWVKYSNGRFGFSSQKEIWCRLGGQIDPPTLDYDYEYKLFQNTFSPYVGWKKGERYLNREDLLYSLDAPAGQLPAAWVQSDTVVGGSHQIYSAWVRLETCDISKISKTQETE
jgi:serine/threonine-protein kinase